jgi:hypothetical protein
MLGNRRVAQLIQTKRLILGGKIIGIQRNNGVCPPFSQQAKRAAAAPTASTLRISRDDKVDPKAALKAGYAAAVKAKDWAQAAIHLNGFTDDEIEAVIKKLSGDQAVELHKAWVGQILGPRLSKLLAPHLLGEGKYNEALAAILHGEAIATLGLTTVTYDARMGSDRFTTDRVAKTVKFGTSAFKGGYAAVVATVTDAVTRSISFVANAPASATPVMTTTVNVAGKVVKSAKVPGGKVTVRTGVNYDTYGSEGFSAEYKGTSSSDSRWLQFIWREIIITDAEKKTSSLKESITTTGGSYDLTTDPKSPNYNTDSGSASSPFYEEAFNANRTADSTTMFDRPASVDAKVQAQFAAGATKVVSKAHFHTFLIRDMSVLHRFDIDVGWNYTTKAVPPRTTSVSGSEAANALPSRMKARLVAQYPKFSYIA